MMDFIEIISMGNESDVNSFNSQTLIEHSSHFGDPQVELESQGLQSA